VHATRPGGRGHARLEFSEKLVHRGTRYRVPTRVTSLMGTFVSNKHGMGRQPAL
jgi:hypothetical protein